MVNYDLIFKDSKYNLEVPKRVKFVFDWIKKHSYTDVVDLGCGRGYYIKPLLNSSVRVMGVEPSHYLITYDLKGLPVTESGILFYNGKHEAMYCMDVLEHIEPSQLDETLQKLTQIAKHGLFGIANHSDIWQEQELHLIQEDSDWWKTKLKQHFKKVKCLKKSERHFIFEVHSV